MKLLKFLWEYGELIWQLSRFVSKYDVIRSGSDGGMLSYYVRNGMRHKDIIVYLQEKGRPERQAFIKFGAVNSISATVFLDCCTDNKD